MAVTALECPGCGAKLSASPGQQTVTCSYCSTTCQVQQQPHGASPWNQHAHAQAAQAAEMGTRAQKIVLVTTLGTTVAGIAMAGVFAVSAPDPQPSAPVAVPTTSMPAIPATPNVPAPAATAMDPAIAADAALMGRLSAYVSECINTLDDRILSSRARYRDWVDDDDGPRPNSRHVYGLYTFRDPSDCAESVAAASALSPRKPEMDAAAQAYVTAVTNLHGVVEEAERYYDRNDYQDDHMARGQELHGPLMANFNAFMVAREALIAHVDAAFEEALTKREQAVAPGDTRHRLLYDTMRNAAEIARTANVHWREVGSIDHDSFFAKADGYQRQVDELEAALGDVSEAERNAEMGRTFRALQSYVQTSQSFAQAAKSLARRVERGGGWSTGERMTLRAGAGSHWMVGGSPGAALAKYNELLRADVSPPLRYIAPTALLSDGY
ncbi:MAG: YiiG family protein [Deltaproteobacteria bacterium]|nr:YiiG family protein [Deltaproteobacteria bacterium]